jgi:hypothetical protein
MEGYEIHRSNNEEEWIAKYRAAITAAGEPPRAMTAGEAFDSFCRRVILNAREIVDKLIRALAPASRVLVPEGVQSRIPNPSSQSR